MLSPSDRNKELALPGTGGLSLLALNHLPSNPGDGSSQSLGNYGKEVVDANIALSCNVDRDRCSLIEQLGSLPRHMNDVAPQFEIADDGNTAEMRAAYLLGRNLHLIEGWVNAVDAIAGCEGRPWTWGDPYTLFGDAFAAWPSDLYWDVGEAVRTLVLARVVVDAAALVEFRHLLELVARDCDSMAEFAACDQRDEIGEMAWPVRTNLMSAMQFATQMLADGPTTMASLQQLGDKLGELLDHLAHVGDHETYPPWLSDLISLARELVPNDEVMKLVQVRNKIAPRGAPTSLSEIWDINRQVICSLQELDRWILANFSAGFSREPYIVVPEKFLCRDE